MTGVCIAISSSHDFAIQGEIHTSSMKNFIWKKYIGHVLQTGINNSSEVINTPRLICNALLFYSNVTALFYSEAAMLPWTWYSIRPTESCSIVYATSKDQHSWYFVQWSN